MTTLLARYDLKLPCKGSYSALVRIVDNKVVAEDSKGMIIASGVVGRDDALVLQSAVDIGGVIVLQCNLSLTSVVRISKHYVTIRGSSEVDPSWRVDHAPIKISGGDNDIFHVSGYGFCLESVTFNNAHKCIVFSSDPADVQIRIATIERCTFVNLHDTPIIFDTANGYLVGPIKIIDNHFYAIGDFPKTSGEVIPSYIKFIGTGYEITDVIIERNDFNPGAVHYIDVDIDGGYIEFISFASNYFEGTCAGTTKLFIDCSGGRVVFFCAIRDCKIVGNSTSGHYHDASGIEIHASNSGSVELKGFHNNLIEGSDIFVDILKTGDISGLCFIGNDIALGDICFEQKGLWWEATIRGILFMANHVASNIYAARVHGFTFSNNSHRDITLSVDNGREVIICDNTEDYSGSRTLTLSIINTPNQRISGNSAYKTENSGCFVCEGTEQLIAHGLAAAPSMVCIVPQNDGAVSHIWADDNFLHFDSSDGVSVKWSARI